MSRAAPLEVDASREIDGAWVVALDGELVVTTEELVTLAVEEALAGGAERVILDASRLDHVDMPGMALLQRLHLCCREAGARLVVAGLPEAFREVAAVLVLDAVLPFADSVEAALAVRA